MSLSLYIWVGISYFLVMAFKNADDFKNNNWLSILIGTVICVGLWPLAWLASICVWAFHEPEHWSPKI